MNEFELDAKQLDALREVANIGAGHAATALSQLTNRRILVEVPTVRVGGLPEESSDGGGDYATVRMQVLGDVTGETLQVFPNDTARRIAGILTGADGGVAETFGDMERSALVEAGNIVAGAYLNALSDFMGMLLLMSVPTMKLGTGAITEASPAAEGGARALVLETRFHMAEDADALDGQFVLVPDPPSVRAILEAIHVA